jgi:hypothetical protein
VKVRSREGHTFTELLRVAFNRQHILASGLAVSSLSLAQMWLSDHVHVIAGGLVMGFGIAGFSQVLTGWADEAKAEKLRTTELASPEPQTSE